MSTTALPPLEPVEEGSKAELLLHPLRQRVLTEAREPSSASEIARRIGMTPQKVNYHVRTLAEAGFLTPAGEDRKGNLIEKRYRASARSYLLLPRVLGETSPDAPTEGDRFSAAHLMQLSALLQEELAAWLDPDAGRAERVPTFSLDAEIRFETAEQRAAFAEAMRSAVTEVVGRHTAPAFDEEGRTRPGRAYRLVVGCYPVPRPEDAPRDPAASTSDQGEA